MNYLTHIRPVFLVFLLIFSLSLSACIERKPERLVKKESPVSAELQNMVAEEEKMAETESKMAGGSSPDSLLSKSLMQIHRQRVLQLLALALVREGVDLYRAALILHSSNEPTVCLQAHYLALEALRKGQTQARFLAATALDRSLILRGVPQRFGTQSFIDKSGKMRLYPIDSLISDSERAAWDVPPLESLSLGK